MARRTVAALFENFSERLLARVRNLETDLEFWKGQATLVVAQRDAQKAELGEAAIRWMEMKAKLDAKDGEITALIQEKIRLEKELGAAQGTITIMTSPFGPPIVTHATAEELLQVAIRAGHGPIMVGGDCLREALLVVMQSPGYAYQQVARLNEQLLVRIKELEGEPRQDPGGPLPGVGSGEGHGVVPLVREGGDGGDGAGVADLPRPADAKLSPLKPVLVTRCGPEGCGEVELSPEDVVRTLQEKGINVSVLAAAYGWTFDVNGEISGLIAGDQCYEPTGIVVEDVKKIWDEHERMEKDLSEIARLVKGQLKA